jgi:hypothetical protein
METDRASADARTVAAPCGRAGVQRKTEPITPAPQYKCREFNDTHIGYQDF